MTVCELRRKLEGIEDSVEVYTYDMEYLCCKTEDARLTKLISMRGFLQEIEDDPDWKEAFSEELKNNEQTTAFLVK